MTTPRIQTRERIYLDKHQYEIVGPVQRQLVSQAPPQFRLGDVDQSQHPNASITSWSDQRGGIGIDVMDNGAEDLSRCWYSTCSLRHKGHIVLQRLATQTASRGVGTGTDALGELKSRVYAMVDTLIHEYDNAGDTWTLRRSMTDNYTDNITAPVAGTETLVVARRSGVDWSTDGSTWNQDETDIQFLAYWRDLLFGLAQDGSFYFTANLSNGWTQLTTFKPVLGSATDLFVGPDREGGEVLYAAAQDGLYVYDNETERFFKTQLAVPYHPDNGKGSVAWRNSIYFPAGIGIYRYTPGFQQNVVELVGPDRDDGLPEDNRGVIRKLVTTHNDLIAVVGPTSQARTAGTQAFRGGTAGPSAHRGAFSGSVSLSSGNSLKGVVLGWDGRGWEVKWEDSSAQGAMQAALVSNAYSQYRLWWAAGAAVYWMEVPIDIVNPNRVSTTAFAASGTWETPWFTADIINFDKTALSVHIDSQHPSSSETITLARALNYDENSSAFVNFVTKTESGDQEYFLPQDDNAEGLPFRAFKIRATLARGATTTNSPDIKRVGLVYRKRVEPLYGFVVNVNLRSNIQGRSHLQQRDDLEAAVASTKLHRFTYRDERDNAQVFWVQATGLTFIDNTGSEASNLAQLVLTEVH